MALIKNTPAVFEAQDDNTIDSDVAVVQESKPAKPAPAATQAAASQAIATASQTSLAVAGTGKKFSAAFQEFQYMFSMEDVRSIGLAAPRLVIDTGGLVKDGKDLGKSITLQLLSYNPRYVVSGGVAGDEGKELVRFSYDGINIDSSGETLKEYLSSLKERGYKNASIKEYFDLWGIVVGGGEEATPVLGETVVVQLSPQSAGQWKFFCVNQGVKIARGLGKETQTVQISVERVKFGSDTFGRAVFTAA